MVVAAGASGNARGVKVEGTKLNVDGCLLVGFDRALDVVAFPGLEAKVTQSILARSGENDRAPGWPIRVQFGGGQATQPRKLTIDHVTARGGGLIEVVDFPSGTPLAVSLDHVAVTNRTTGSPSSPHRATGSGSSPCRSTTSPSFGQGQAENRPKRASSN